MALSLKQLHTFLKTLSPSVISSSAQYLRSSLPPLIDLNVEDLQRIATTVESRDVIDAADSCLSSLQDEKDILLESLGKTADQSQLNTIVGSAKKIDGSVNMFYKSIQLSIQKEFNHSSSNGMQASRKLQPFLSRIAAKDVILKTMLEHYITGLSTFYNTSGTESQLFYKYGVVQEVNILHIVQETVSHLESMSVSYFGAQPPIKLVFSHDDADSNFRAIAIESQIHFVVMELLKNSVKSLVDRYGALNLDNPEKTPSIIVRLSRSGSSVAFQVEDQGGGIPVELRQGKDRLKLFDYFSSTKREDPNPTYTYSRSFGPAFSGHGMGLAQSMNFVKVIHGGNIELASLPGHGTVVVVYINAYGNEKFYV